MFSKFFDSIASKSGATKALMDEASEFRALKIEINKARCVFEFNADGLITFVNENALCSLAYSPGELISQHHRTLLGHAESTSQEYQQFWSNLSEGKSNTGTFQLVNKSGEKMWFQGYYAPIMDSAGKLRKVVAYLTDTSHQHDMLTNLQAEDQGINNIFGVMEFDPEIKILDVNDVFLKALGYKKEELVGRHIGILLTQVDNDNPEFLAMWKKVIEGETQTQETRRLAKDKKELWFQTSFSPVKSAEGKVVRVISYSTCITAVKNQSSDYLGQLKAISKIQGVIEFDLKGNIIAVNENFAAVTGYSEKEIVGNHHSMFVDATYKSSNEYKNFWDKLARGEADEGVYKRIGKGGEEIWLQASYNPIYDANGKPFKVVKYATDITKIRVEAADSAGQIEAINKTQGVIEFDLKGNILRVNENFANVTGYSVNEIVGNHHSMFIDVAYKSSSEYKAFWEKLAKGEYDAGQYLRIGKGGKEVWLQASYNPIFDLNGKPFKVVKYATDITEQHNNAESLANAVEESQVIIGAAKSGDLSSRISLENKTGAVASLCDGVNALIDKMTELLISVREAGETINTAASEISTGNNDLSSRTEQQASSLEETASSMEELASTVKQNAENAKQANQLAAAASGVAVKGGQVVGEVVATMSAINESAHKIEDIISVIDGIAFQTNILALNAAVEAARAGEQGRGFAVVAGEVRNLAQRSASAAKEIKDLITDSVSKTAAGTRQVENAGNTMQEIVSSVQRVTDIMGEISAASSEQSAGIDQVNNAITSMDEVTQQNAALVEEAAAAAESLVDQAVSLIDVVSSFKLQGGGTNGRRSNNSAMRTVTHKPVSSPISKPVSKASPAKLVTKTGTDNADEWEEF
jgi:methyl-accepting chemotaxis protein